MITLPIGRACVWPLLSSLVPCPALLAGDAGIEEAVASRLYRAELAAAEAQAKLGDWCVAAAA